LQQSYSILDPVSDFELNDLPLSNRTASGGTCLWAEGDGVHLSQKGYPDPAKTVDITCAELFAHLEDGESESGSLRTVARLRALYWIP
jgi:hypothetical protein